MISIISTWRTALKSPSASSPRPLSINYLSKLVYEFITAIRSASSLTGSLTIPTSQTDRGPCFHDLTVNVYIPYCNTRLQLFNRSRSTARQLQLPQLDSCSYYVDSRTPTTATAKLRTSSSVGLVQVSVTSLQVQHVRSRTSGHLLHPWLKFSSEKDQKQHTSVQCLSCDYNIWPTNDIDDNATWRPGWQSRTQIEQHSVRTFWK